MLGFGGLPYMWQPGLLNPGADWGNQQTSYGLQNSGLLNVGGNWAGIGGLPMFDMSRVPSIGQVGAGGWGLSQTMQQPQQAAAPAGYAPASMAALINRQQYNNGMVYQGTPGWTGQNGQTVDPNAHLFSQIDQYGEPVYYNAMGTYAGGGGYDNTP